jgi:flavin-dependent dehydrogenase
VGIGRRESQDFNNHVKQFAAFLEYSGALSDAADLKWRGHAYLASGTGARPVIDEGILLIGDAAGLAYPESGEGIRPAIESGRLAARTLAAADGRTSRGDLQPYADELRRLYPPASRTLGPLRSAVAAMGRLLLGSPAFTRHVVLDRWFLRRAAAHRSS